MTKDVRDIRIKDLTFKSAFKATMGYYAAQFVATVLGVAVIAALFLVASIALK